MTAGEIGSWNNHSNKEPVQLTLVGYTCGLSLVLAFSRS
jgi:hypothetical protein